MSAPGPSQKWSRPKVWLSVAVVAAIVLRLGAAYVLRDSFFHRGNRFNIINPIAEQLLAGNGFSAYPGGPTADNEPLYPLFVTLSYGCLGRAWWSLALTQTSLGLLHAWLVFKIAYFMWGSRRTAICAGILILFYPPYAIAAISVTDTVFFSCLLALCTLLTIRCVTQDRLLGVVVAGMVWGFAILSRLSAIALLPAVIVYPWLSLGLKRGGQKVLLLGACAMMVVAPWMWRNYRLTGRAFVSSHGAIELWFAYNEDTQSVIRRDISVDRMRIGVEERLPEIGKIRNCRVLNPIEREVGEAEVFKREALSYARTHPVESLKMIPLKFWKLWSWRYSPIPTSPDPRQDVLRRSVHALSYGPVLLMATVGLVCSLSSRWRQHALVLGYFVGYSALHALIYGFSRLRWPMDQFLIVYAVYALSHIKACLHGKGQNQHAA